MIGPVGFDTQPGMPCPVHSIFSSSSSLTSLAAIGLLAASGCTEPGSPADVPIEITATGGIGDGDTAGDGGDADDGLDETGSGPSESPECLFDPDPDFFGYKYQCVGGFTVKIEVNDLDPEFLIVDFGSATSPDSYDEPHVMACCPEYEGPPCAEPHAQACVVDMIEQGCKSLVPRLEELAEDRPLLKEPILKTAEWIAKASSQAACIQAFVFDTGVGDTVPSCDANNNTVFPYDGAVDGAMWSFDPDTTTLVDSVVLTIENPEVFDWTAPGDPPQPEQCESSGDNDHLFFLEIDPTIGDVKVSLAGGSVTLVGPVLGGEKISGNATLASTGTQCAAPYCSHAAWTLGPSGDGDLHSMSFYSKGASDVGTSAEEVTVDSFQIHLFTPAKGTVSQGKLTIPAGEALFVVSASSLDESRWLSAWNSTAIEIRPVRGYWSISTFTIDYEDASGDVWDMDLAPSTWR